MISKNFQDIYINSISSLTVGSLNLTNSTITNMRSQNIVTNNITSGDIYFTGSIYQNGTPFTGSSVGGSSQWSGTNGSLIYFGSTGSVNVGIGTTNPQNTLDVNGTGRFSTLTSTNLLTTNASISNISITNFNPTNITASNINVTTSLKASGTTNTIGNIITTSSGFVGINTPTTSNMLTINAGANQGAFLLTGSNTDSAVAVFENTSFMKYAVGSVAGSAAGSGFSIYDVTNNAIRINIGSSGNTGFGNTSPKVRLDLTQDNAQNIALYTDGVSYYGFGANAASIKYQTNTYHKFYTGSSLGSTGPEIANIDSTGFGTSGKISAANVVVTGNISIGNNLIVAGTLTSVNITSTNLIQSNVISVNNTLSNLLISNGNIGINVASPSVKLDILANETSGVFSVLNVKANMTNGSNMRYFFSGKDFAGSNGLWQYYTHLSDGNSLNYTHWDWNGFNNILVTNATGRVGIATTSPSQRLNVSGPPISGSVEINIDNLSFTSSNLRLGVPNIAGSILSNGITGSSIISNNFGSLHFGTGISGSASGKMIIDTSGNIGINVINPVQKLDINGSMCISDVNNGQLFLANTTTGSARLNIRDLNNRLIAFQYGLITLGSVNVTSTTSGGYTLTANDTSQLVISPNGNIGIGTSSPESSLHVVGVRANVPGIKGIHLGEAGPNDYAIEICAANTAAGSYIDFTSPAVDFRGRVFYDHSANAMTFSTNSSEKMRINSRGNLALGGLNAQSGLSIYINSTVSNTENSENGIQIFSTNGVTSATLYMGADAYTGSGISYIQSSKSGANLPLVFNNRGGNVGIATTSPAYQLDVVSGEATDTMRVYNTNASGYGSIIYKSNNTQWIGGVGGSGDATFGGKYYLISSNGITNSIVGLTNGNWGINTANPSYQFDVNGTIASSGVPLPKFSNGTFSSGSLMSVFFGSGSPFNYAEFKIRFKVGNSGGVDVTLGARDSLGATVTPSEPSEVVTQYNTTVGTLSTSAFVGRVVEGSGLDHQLNITVTKGVDSIFRCHYRTSSTFTWAFVGTSRLEGSGGFATGTLANLVLTAAAGTLSGSYSSIHYY